MINLRKWERRISRSSRNTISSVLKYLPKGGTFIDIGANTGAVTKAALDLRRAHVYAFEPVHDYAKACRELCGDKVQVEQFALGTTKGRRTLWCSTSWDRTTNPGWNTLIKKMVSGQMQPIKVDIIPFDDYAQDKNIDRIDVVKIDVEGYEYAVLGGMHKSLLRFHPVLIVELAWGKLHPKREKEVEQIEWLFANGYKRINYDFNRTKDLIFLPATII